MILKKIKNAPELDENGKNLTIKNENIAFQNVNFSYDDKQVIKNVNFEVPTQTSTAIIGPSGSGNLHYVTYSCAFMISMMEIFASMVLILKI